MRRAAAFFLACAFFNLSFLNADESFAPDRVIVCLKSSLNLPAGGISSASFNTLPQAASRLLARTSALSIKPLYSNNRSPFLNPQSVPAAALQIAHDRQRRTLVLKLNAGADVEAVVNDLRRDPLVEYAEPDYKMKLVQSANDTSYAVQWGLRNTGQAGSVDGFDPPTGTAGVDIDAELAWDTQVGFRTPIVAVIDTGVQYSHADLSANIYSNAAEDVDGVDDDGNGFIDDIRGWDFGAGDNNPLDNCVDLQDSAGHGTHVAGILGAVGNNGTGVSGVNWRATIMPLKIADPTCSLFISDAAAALDYAVDMGVDVVNMSFGGSDSATLKTAVDAASAAGLVLIAAAGNDGTSSKFYPAAYTGVVAVAATDRRDQRASFSNFGDWITLTAPGVGIYSTIPTGTYGYKSGTSMASPMVAGLAALVLSQYPTLTSAQVVDRLINSCESISALNSGFNGLLGAGRINAARALLNLTNVSPSIGEKERTVNLTLTGTAFMSGLGVELRKTGESTITATNVSVSTLTTLTCQVDLTGAAIGVWDVVLVIGQTEVTLAGAFTVEALTLSSISPSVVTDADPPFTMTLTGLRFAAGMTAKLQKTGQSDVSGTLIAVDNAATARYTFAPAGLKGGRWDVVIATDGPSATLAGGLAVTSEEFLLENPSLTQETAYTVVQAAGSAQIVWPSGATSSAIQLEMNGDPDLPALNTALDPYAATGIGMEITATPAQVLAAPFTLTLPYRGVDLPTADKETALTLATYNETTGRWEPLASQVDTVARTVTARPTHLSFFQILQHVAAPSLGNMIAFPNPFRGNRHNRIIFDFLTAGSRVRIFDVSGHLVRDLNDEDNDGQIIWPVTNEDGEPMASGVYVYRVTDGQGQEKTGRLGIIR